MLDLNAGLTQVLQAGGNTYLYGNEHTAQFDGTNPTYFLGDALGSVRQLAEGSGIITLAKNYAPFGQVLSSVGVSASNYAFTGEWASSASLLYLRARLYDSSIGRFLSRDTWKGNANTPITYNTWIYAVSNPIIYVDATDYKPFIILACGMNTDGACGKQVYEACLGGME